MSVYLSLSLTEEIELSLATSSSLCTDCAMQCHAIAFNSFRPHGTVVPGELMFYCWCFLGIATRSPSSVGRSPRNFATWSDGSSAW